MFTSVKRKSKKRKSPIRSQRRRSSPTVKKKEGGSNVTRWLWVGGGVVLVCCILLYVSSFANSTATRGSRALQGGVHNLLPMPGVAYPTPIPLAYPVHNNNMLGSSAGYVFFAITGVIILVVVILVATHRDV